MTVSSQRRRASPKGDRQRKRIMEAGQAVIGERGFANATMESIAQRVGISRSGVLHYFPSKDVLVEAILSERRLPDDDRFQHSLERAASRTVLDAAAILERNATDRQWVAFYSGTLSEALRDGHPSREFFTLRYALFRSMLAQSIRNGIDDGSLRGDASAPDVAALVIAVLDGLQQQWLYDPDLDMARIYESFLRMLRGGTAAESPVRSADVTSS
ncbi:TetR/AcrR family transcriptional regulator [Curtobacterium sp. USHLN213]|uniref:TetR/AcrR family transcriptional regulator n=1 Tax=Curtobacterium sp. USHLN213 TaxID=3081255 RepID=UPI003015E46F